MTLQVGEGVQLSTGSTCPELTRVHVTVGPVAGDDSLHADADVVVSLVTRQETVGDPFDSVHEPTFVQSSTMSWQPMPAPDASGGTSVQLATLLQGE